MPKAAQVGTVDCYEFASMDDLRQFLPGGDTEIVKLATTQYNTNLKNEARRLAQIATPSKTSLRTQAEKVLWENDEIATAIIAEKDPAAKSALREKFLQAEITNLEADYAAKREAMGSSAGATAGAATEATETEADAE
jgi:hypothetical protein